MLQRRPELTPYPSISPHQKKKNTTLVVFQLNVSPYVAASKWWYGHDGCVWASVSSQGRAPGKQELSCSGSGHSPNCQTASLQSQLPRKQDLAESQGQHGRALVCSRSTNHTLLTHQLKQAQGQDWIPFVSDGVMKPWAFIQKAWNRA